MAAPKELKFLKTIKTGKGLPKLIISLRNSRRINKVKAATRSQLTKSKEKLYWQKRMAVAMFAALSWKRINFMQTMLNHTSQAVGMMKKIICLVAVLATIFD